MSKMALEIAEITFDPKARQIRDLTFFKKNFRFKCQRCAIFCCNLGGPQLSIKDIEKLRKNGYNPEIYVNNVKKKDGNKQFMKEKEDGSCIFLKYDPESKKHACTIYKIRPSVCRLYPFEFLLNNRNTGTLRIIPCCRGLNALDGKIVDHKFIKSNLLRAIFDSID